MEESMYRRTACAPGVLVVENRVLTWVWRLSQSSFDTIPIKDSLANSKVGEPGPVEPRRLQTQDVSPRGDEASDALPLHWQD